MSTVIIEHVKVGDLPEAWRERLARPSDARVTVRIEEETGARDTPAAQETADDPLFGMWRDREDMADVEAYVRKLRAPRF
jgi:hypothetical protein